MILFKQETVLKNDVWNVFDSIKHKIISNLWQRLDVHYKWYCYDLNKPDLNVIVVFQWYFPTVLMGKKSMPIWWVFYWKYIPTIVPILPELEPLCRYIKFLLPAGHFVTHIFDHWSFRFSINRSLHCHGLWGISSQHSFSDNRILVWTVYLSVVFHL